MTEKTTATAATVIPLRKPALASKASEQKWGAEVMKLGFSVLPSLLFRAQRRLGLSPTQLTIVLQIADYWWDQDRKPYPSKQTLSERIGLSPRQIQRHIEALEDNGLIKRVERRGRHGGILSNEYDLSGLVKRLKKLEPEFREVKAMARKVSRPGGIAKPAK
jgi:DNA-binding transcriptional ArsR family regulator